VHVKLRGDAGRGSFGGVDAFNIERSQCSLTQALLVQHLFLAGSSCRLLLVVVSIEQPDDCCQNGHVWLEVPPCRHYCGHPPFLRD
jgi:hypothetical protein